VVPTIGPLFLLSFIGSGVVGGVLVAPVRRLGRSIGDLILVLAALGAIGIALGSLVSLLISEYTPLFGEEAHTGFRHACCASSACVVRGRPPGRCESCYSCSMRIGSRRCEG
jgi:hypothetical protein